MPRGFQRRDILLALFWPDLNSDEARRSLRQALHQLRRAVGENAIVSRSDDQVGLVDGAIWCDAVELERLADTGDHERVLELYTGDFLAGVFVPGVAPELEEWMARVRHRLRARASESAGRLAIDRERRGDIDAAVRAAQRACDLTPDDEATVRRCMSLHAAAGNVAAALAAYDELARHLRDLDASPSAETRAVVDAIRRSVATGRAAVRVESIVTSSVTNVADPTRLLPTAPAPVPEPPRLRRSWLLRRSVIGATLVGLLVVLALSRRESPAAGGGAGSDATSLIARGALRARDRVFVARFSNGTRDSTLGQALAGALDVDLAQSPVIQVLSEDERRDALRRMKRPLELSLDDTLARELAIREGVKAFITADVRQLAGEYVLSASIRATPSGTMLTAVRELARDSSQIIPALGRLSAEIRRRIGEAVASLRAIPPLDRATTASLPALRAYTRAMYHIEVSGDRDSSIALLEHAVELDTAFASAWRMLGSTYASEGDPGRASAALAHAYANRDRLPLRDRYLTIGSYNRTVTHDYDKAAASYRALLETYPTDIAAMNNLAMTYGAARQLQRAESMYVRLLASDSTIPSVYLGLAQNLMNQAKFAESRRVLDGVHARFPTYPITRMTETYLAAAQQDWSRAEDWARKRLEASSSRIADATDANQTLGDIMLLTGRLAEAERCFRDVMRLSVDTKSPGQYLGAAIMMGWLELRYRHRSSAAIGRVDEALTRYPLRSLQPADRPYVDLAGFWLASGQSQRLRAMLATADADSASRAQLDGAPRHLIAGYLAIAAHDGRRAIDEFREADAFMRCPLCALPGLAQAFVEAGDVEGGIAVYERYLTTPWMWRFETDAPNLGSSIEQLGDLYRRQGRPEKARDAYARLLRLWTGADAELADDLRRIRQKAEQ